jgi:hypothetical protein
MSIRKHKGIIQTGGNFGKLKKGYRYSGKKLKSGLPQIVKSKKNKKHKKVEIESIELYHLVRNKNLLMNKNWI